MKMFSKIKINKIKYNLNRDRDQRGLKFDNK